MTTKTQYDSHPRVHQTPGSREHTLYKSEVLPDGTITLTPSGVENIYDKIQSHRDSCDINVILKRYANGETEVLARAQGAYGDFSTLPTSFAELLQTVIDGRSTFEQLPVETRAKFNHSFEQWMASMDNMPTWLANMGYSPDPAATTPPEVNTNEPE